MVLNLESMKGTRRILFQQNFLQLSRGSSHFYLVTCISGSCHNKIPKWSHKVAISRRSRKLRQFYSCQTLSSQESRNSGKERLASSVPESLASLSENSFFALTKAIEAGYRRLLVDIDLQQGDPTYTTLKNAVPFICELIKVIEQHKELPTATLLFPDEGSAAFARKDWNFSESSFLSFASYSGKESSRGWLIMICPSAVDVEVMERIVDRESPFLSDNARPIILINPNLVDMGATGFGFNARQLRKRLLSTFEPIYYLRVYSWGVVVRQYPLEWSVWLDEANSDEGNSSEEGPYRLLDCFQTNPSEENIQELLRKSVKTKISTGTNWFQSFVSFLKWYSKG